MSAQEKPDGAPPRITDALRETAMLVQVHTTALGATRLDRRASAELNQDKKAASGTGRVSVKRLPGADALHTKLVNVQARAGENVADNTVPWGRDKRKVLPNKNFERWIGTQYKLEAEFKDLVGELETNADDMIATAERCKGDLNAQIPTRDELVTAYSLSYTLEPIPAAEFPGLEPEAQEWLIGQYEKNAQAMHRDGLAAGLARALKPLQNVVERIDAYDKKLNTPKDQRTHGEGGFKDTLVTNVTDILDYLESVNLLNDPVFASFVEEMQIFRAVSASDLRKHDPLRAAVKSKAAETIERLSGYLGGMGL